ncbi:hypothetical protein R1sor_019994 [Riccia sorocarpa]|uniref:Uncharacterized protein n=1 Tax=Riccia sorocarpa TaxID=122646 RepID=A0ABD3IE95_9MARC
MATHKQNAQDEDEDVGPFAIECLSDSGEDKSAEEVLVTGRRFKETLREQKLPRLQAGSSRKRRPGEVDSSFVHSKLTPECLAKELRQFCCKNTYVWNLGLDMLHREHEAVEALKLHRKQQAEERAAAGGLPPERDEHAIDEPVAVTTTEEFMRRIFGHRRPIYSGPRRPPPGSAAADRATHIGELTEIHEKSFLAVLADDETSFWICQILKINRRNAEGEPTSDHI